LLFNFSNPSILDEEGSWRRNVQKYLDRFWMYLSDGCSCARDTKCFIEDAGFSSYSCERFIAEELTLIAWIMRSHIVGYAVK
jgi:hypothetical protein